MYVSEEILNKVYESVEPYEKERPTPDSIPYLGKLEKREHPKLIPNPKGLRNYNTSTYISDFLSKKEPLPERCPCRKRTVAEGIFTGII